MNRKYLDLKFRSKQEIDKGLSNYFDNVTYLNKENWLMKYKYGNKYIYQSFETHVITDDYEEFEAHKLFLFSTGISLYYIHSIDKIELIYDVDLNKRS